MKILCLIISMIFVISCSQQTEESVEKSEKDIKITVNSVALNGLQINKITKDKCTAAAPEWVFGADSVKRIVTFA